MLTNKKIISFHDLGEYPFKNICDLGTCESFDSTEWATSDDEDRRREFVWLLNQCLREKTRIIGLRYDEDNNYFYFPATRELTTSSVQYQSLKQRVSREVFKQYFKKNSSGIRAYCRHSACKGYFLNIENSWYLEITPTYHFTRNGYDKDIFGDERLKGIKRLERNPAVLGQIIMWASYLKGPKGNLFSDEYTLLRFGDLATVDVTASLPDKIWYQAEEGIEELALKAPENQLQFIGL